MKYSLIILGLFAVCGCGTNKSVISNPASDDGPPAQTFQLDAEKKLIYVGVFGRQMGTPDFEKINSYLESKKSEGVIDGLETIWHGIEGGAGYCVDIRDKSNRQVVLEELSKIPTSLSQTSYSLISVEDCICFRQDSACN